MASVIRFIAGRRRGAKNTAGLPRGWPPPASSPPAGAREAHAGRLILGHDCPHAQPPPRPPGAPAPGRHGLPDGTVLVAGGDDRGVPLRAELDDPGADRWQPVRPRPRGGWRPCAASPGRAWRRPRRQPVPLTGHDGNEHASRLAPRRMKMVAPVGGAARRYRGARSPRDGNGAGDPQVPRIVAPAWLGARGGKSSMKGRPARRAHGGEAHQCRWSTNGAAVSTSIRRPSSPVS
jgi:hypothetical protein